MLTDWRQNDERAGTETAGVLVGVEPPPPPDDVVGDEDEPPQPVSARLVTAARKAPAANPDLFISPDATCGTGAPCAPANRS